MTWRRGYGETGGGSAPLTDGWQLYDTLDFAGVTPAASMTVSGQTVTMSSTTNWSAVASGIRCTPSTAGTDLDVALDTWLGAGWQTWSWLLIVDFTNTSMTAGIDTWCVIGAVVQRVNISTTAADVYLDGASVAGASSSITGANIEAMALLVQDRCVSVYTSTTTDPEYADLTFQGSSTRGGLSNSTAESGRVLRLGTTHTGDLTVRRIRALRRSQVAL